MKKEDGLVFSFILQGGSGQRLDWEQVKRWNPAQGILWLHLDFKNERVKNWLFEESGIDAVSCEALLAEETRPRIVPSVNSLLLILRGVNCNPGADPEDMVSIRMWFDENRIISMRHRRVMAIEDINKSIEIGKGPDSANDFLVMVANKLAGRIGDVINEIDDSVDELEELVMTEESHKKKTYYYNINRNNNIIKT